MAVLIESSSELVYSIQRVLVIRPFCQGREQQWRSGVTKIYANGPMHMLISHIYIKVNRLSHCFLTPASIHDYLCWFLCKMPYKHGAGILSTCHWVCFQWQPKVPITGYNFRAINACLKGGAYPPLNAVMFLWLPSRPLDLSPFPCQLANLVPAPHSSKA